MCSLDCTVYTALSKLLWWTGEITVTYFGQSAFVWRRRDKLEKFNFFFYCYGPLMHICNRVYSFRSVVGMIWITYCFPRKIYLPAEALLSIYCSLLATKCKDISPITDDISEEWTTIFGDNRLHYFSYYFNIIKYNVEYDHLILN